MFKDKLKTYKTIIFLSLIGIVLKLFSMHPYWVEKYYSAGIYKLIASVWRILLGWIPISIGDILIAIVVWMVLRNIFLFFRKLFKKQLDRQTLFMGAKKIVTLILFIYVFFLLNWGLNYDRLGIGYQLHLQRAYYSTSNLDSLTKDLANHTNIARKNVAAHNYPLAWRNDSLFYNGTLAYKNLAEEYPFLKYQIKSIKSSIYSELQNYMGYSGYLNPFTGEAQVNTHTPPIERAFVTCHEMAHQLGYGTEDEANFVGFLAARASANEAFRYSAYLAMFNYANDELFARDSSLARHNYKSLDTLVRKDLKEMSLFYKKYRNRIAPIINIIYGQYLKANNQPQGLETYSDVVSLLVALRKEKGGI